MQWNLAKYATECRKLAVSAKVSLNRKAYVDFRQHVRSFSRNFSPEI